MEMEQKKARIFSKLLVSCVIYTIISHYILSVSYESLNLNGLQTAVRSFTTYSVMFLVFSMAPLLIGLGIAKSTLSNRKKSITPYFNSALIVTWVIALIGLYGGWYGNKRVNEYYEKQPEVASSTFNSIVKNMVDEIVIQLPIQINKNTFLTSVIYLNDSVYYYYLLDSEVDKGAFHREMKVFVHNRFCTDPDMEIFIKYAKNIRVHREYTNTQGIVLSNISMIASDCKL